ncbi:MAG: CBS domain-containing protein [Flavobacteriaceae bacterium]|nr:CBS domain-containing protein [Flavobacteriaceae bacterium]
MKNTIAERIYDFLKMHPPFNVLSQQELYKIAENVRVLYFEENEYIFKCKETIHQHFYIVKEGAIGIYNENESFIVDKCDEGDIFGLRALIRKNNYILTAKSVEESIVYSISSDILTEIISTNLEANKFLIASFATNMRNPYSNEDKGTLFANVQVLQASENHFTEVQSAQYSKNPISCPKDTIIRDAARTMTDKRVGSIVITENKKPIGIITDKDLRTKIATGTTSIEENVSSIMSSPVISYPSNITVAEAQIAMLQHKITHLCITEDGTASTELKGILSEHDIIVVRGNNPSVLIKEVKRANTVEDLQYIRKKVHNLLKRYIEQNIPIVFIANVISAINDAITSKAIDFSVKEMEHAPKAEFTWLALGSQGRSEQLLFTDQDNALVFENVSEEKNTETKNYFLSLSEKITRKLHIIGFEYCPAEMMASNPKWCLSLSEWKQQFNNWITHPDEDKIMLCTIFFDYNVVYGSKKLVDEMSESIFKSINEYEIFLNFLGVNSLRNPAPLSFFRQFLVEHSGEHKDQFDLKARALMPLIDAARLLVLSLNSKDVNSTVKRFEKLAILEPQNEDLYHSCINAFKILLRYRTEEGIKHNDSGRYIDLNELNKTDRLKLKGCFKPIKDIQELITTRFNLSQFK